MLSSRGEWKYSAMNICISESTATRHAQSPSHAGLKPVRLVSKKKYIEPVIAKAESKHQAMSKNQSLNSLPKSMNEEEDEESGPVMDPNAGFLHIEA